MVIRRSPVMFIAAFLALDRRARHPLGRPRLYLGRRSGAALVLTFGGRSSASGVVASFGHRPAAARDRCWTAPGPDRDRRVRFLPRRRIRSSWNLRSVPEVDRGGDVGTDDALLLPVGHDLGVLYPTAGSDHR